MTYGEKVLQYGLVMEDLHEMMKCNAISDHRRLVSLQRTRHELEIALGRGNRSGTTFRTT